MQEGRADVGRWLDEAVLADPQVAFIVRELDDRAVAFVREHEPGEAIKSLHVIYQYREGIQNINGYVRVVFQKHGVKRASAIQAQPPTQQGKRQCQGSSNGAASSQEPLLPMSPTVTSSPPSSPSASWQTEHGCSSQQAHLPVEPSSDEVRGHYHHAFAQELERQLRHGRGAARAAEAQEPSAKELSTMLYSATLCVDASGRPTFSLKRPRVNAHMKRCFHRFGSDRFLFVDVPNEGILESHLEPLTLCGRRFVFALPKRTMSSLKHLKAQNGPSAPAGYGSVVAVFFAESGPGLDTCRADQFRSWHLPLDLACARGMTVSKYAERFKLAFSDADRTLEVQVGEIEVTDDLRGCRGKPNTDGNGLGSAQLFEKIADCLGCPGRRISAVQIRLGPAKGMLVRCDRVSKDVLLFAEQVKYGDQSYYATCEPCQRTIEVCSNGVVFADEEHRHFSRLNSQLILVLQAVGCPAQVFLDLDERLRQSIERFMPSTSQLVQSDFLPNADVADGHSSSDLCFQIHAMHAAGMDHRTDNYLFMCVRRYIQTQLQKAREDGHLPCPDCYSLTMISDFSRALRPGTMSVWMKGRGFARGRHLVTRIPCGYPGDVVLLEAVDDFSRSNPGFSYENLAVMSAHDSLVCSPASRMSGGDYDGDKAFIIGFPPIVESASALVEREPTSDELPDPLRGEYRATKLRDVVATSEARGQPVHAAVEEALKRACGQMVEDAATVGKVNVMWTYHADRDISFHGRFQDRTLFLARHQELALDSAKTGWRMDPEVLTLLKNERPAPRPHWYRPGQGPARDQPIASRSALGQLTDLEDPVDWIARALSRFGPPSVEEGHSLMGAAGSLDAKLPQSEKAAYLGIWDSAYSKFRQDKRSVTDASPGVSTWQRAIESARAVWHAQVDETGRSRDAFALVVYWKCHKGTECWDLCFNELCHIYATRVAGKEVVSVVRGGCVSLRSARPAVRQEDFASPLPVPPEQTRQAALLSNLKGLERQHGPRDGGDLVHVPRGGPDRLPVQMIRWTHKDPSDHFKDGRSIESLVDDLEAGRVRLDAPFLSLDVVEFDACYWSLRNRRLVALRKYEKRLRDKGLSDEVYAFVHVLPLANPAVLVKFLEGFSTDTWGESVELRESSKTRRAGLASHAGRFEDATGIVDEVEDGPVLGQMPAVCMLRL